MTDNIVPFPTFAVELARACEQADEQADEYEAALWQLVGAIERMSGLQGGAQGVAQDLRAASLGYCSTRERGGRHLGDNSRFVAKGAASNVLSNNVGA